MSFLTRNSARALEVRARFATILLLSLGLSLNGCKSSLPDADSGNVARPTHVEPGSPTTASPPSPLAVAPPAPEARVERSAEGGRREHDDAEQEQKEGEPAPDRLALEAPAEPAAAPASAPADKKAEKSRGKAPKVARAPAPAATGGGPLQGMAQGVGSSAGHGRLGGAHKDGTRGVQNANPPFHTESYKHIEENRFLSVKDQPLSTFSIDVDTASYANSRRFLNDGQLPPPDAIRVEEWVNYFRYAYPAPSDGRPFAVHTEVASCPWNAQHRLVKIGIKGTVGSEAIAARNLVFLVDVSGSMMSGDKLPLLKRGLGMLVRSLRPEDRISMVVYAGASGLVLPPTAGSQQGKILAALQGLEAGGSTNGADGIRLAYQVAQQSFAKGGINRVILATDGDFNVGTTSEGELTRLIEEKRKSGVFLTVLGFGTGNLKDSTMETLADKGNGNYAYIDSPAEAHKVLVREAGSTLVTIAKDVKLQVEFNPKKVQSYKLVGYENRLLAKEDFNDDKKDAGEIGAGHTVTALYEVVPVGAPAPAAAVDALKYQATGAPTAAADSNELMTVNVRYKAPQGHTSTKFSQVVQDPGVSLESASPDFRFAAAVAGFALLLRAPDSVAGTSFEEVKKLARSGLGADAGGERAELLALVDRARTLGASKR